jgi:hypothetical protein
MIQLTKEKLMNQTALDFANQAVFQLQMNTQDAIRYVVRHASVDPKTAGQALKQVMVGYKS